MDFQKAINELREFDLGSLEFENVGSWPIAIKIIIWVLVLAGCLFLGYQYDTADMQVNLDSAKAKEVKLKKQFEDMAHKAANLDAYRKQMVEMEESFESLLGQLPSDTEVPGLLEDITNKGVDNGLEISSIALNAEVTKEFYAELPMDIKVKGAYHDFGAFVSGVSGLPRIVTLHNFTIDTSKEGGGILEMNIGAKTYRYNSDNNEGGK